MTRRKTVSFSEEEYYLYDYAMRYENFSKYIKDLIKVDKEKGILLKSEQRKPSIYEIYESKRKKTT